MAEDNSAAWPQADQALSQEILDLVQQATHYRQLKVRIHHLTSLVTATDNHTEGCQRGYQDSEPRYF